MLLALACVGTPLPTTAILAPAEAQAQGIVITTSTPQEAPAIPLYVLSNCYAYVRYMIPNFPMASLIRPNTTPHVGAVAIFDYDGLPHYGIISTLTTSGFNLTDSNYGGAGIRTHFVEWSNKYIVGFWSS